MKHVLMMIGISLSVIATSPLFIPALLPIAVIRERKTLSLVIQIVTIYGWPAVMKDVRAGLQKATPEDAEAQPEMTVVIPVIILINPVVTLILMKPGAVVVLIHVPMVAAVPVPAARAAAQGANVTTPVLLRNHLHHPPAAVMAAVATAAVMAAVATAVVATVLREEVRLVPENRLVQAMKKRTEVVKIVPEKHFIPARKKEQHASTEEVRLVPENRLVEATRKYHLLAKLVPVKRSIPARK